MIAANALANAWNAQAVAIAATSSLIPLIVPPILSRARYLSAARWLAMAGFLVFLIMVSSVALAIVIATQSSPTFTSRFVAMLSTITIAGSIFGIGGCLLAAAIHPKSR